MIAGCGETSAAYVTARALGCDDFAVERIDSRAVSVADEEEFARVATEYALRIMHVTSVRGRNGHTG